MSKDRFTHGAANFERHKGIKIGTLYTNRSIDGDVTLTPAFDELDAIEKVDILTDIIGLLRRELDTINGDDKALDKAIGEEA